MIKDRLKEMREKSSNFSSLIIDNKREESSFAKISLQLNLVRDKLAQTGKDLEDARGCHDAILSSPITDQVTNDRLELIMKSIQTNIREIGAELKRIDKEANDYFRTGQVTGTELRMLRNIHESLIAQLRNVYDELQSARIAFENRCKSRIQRSLTIAGYNATEEDVEEALEKGTPIFSKEFADTVEAKSTLRDIQERHDQLVGLEKNLEELRNMFADLATMVSLQGETVDRIETAVALSSNEVSRAQNELQEAETTKKKWQRKKYFIYVLVASVMVTLVGILVFKLT